jgi:hypothetical protein
VLVSRGRPLRARSSRQIYASPSCCTISNTCIPLCREIALGAVAVVVRWQLSLCSDIHAQSSIAMMTCNHRDAHQRFHQRKVVLTAISQAERLRARSDE